MEKSTEPCPKCGVLPYVGAKECPGCGLIFKKWISQNMGGHVNASQRLELAWEAVLANWENPVFHNTFIQQANLEKNLPFASLKYKRILDADPTNEVAQQKKAQTLQLVMMSFMTAEDNAKEGTFSKSVYVLLGLGIFLIFVGTVTPSSLASIGQPFIWLGVICFVAAWFVRRLQRI